MRRINFRGLSIWFPREKGAMLSSQLKDKESPHHTVKPMNDDIPQRNAWMTFHFEPTVSRDSSSSSAVTLRSEELKARYILWIRLRNSHKQEVLFVNTHPHSPRKC
ncbi:hypothetical protein JOB18_035255 [Solea senegalensis]|uniref:Uncharacterized protein n=1 Tax=Solea senegalensis TaxID=28829 RepID=A0AAV6PHX7_SOLSE|nr:hypothetical protein JOB18_035255 [Solea senegalensis]KAG7461406.1 hypothetical protein JOB18_035255 [Solea senegalensis]